MTEEFNLSEEREDFKFAMNLAKLSPLARKQLEHIFEVIENQDKEFIKRLKEEIIVNVVMHYESEPDEIRGIPIDKLIDKLAGDKLILEEFNLSDFTVNGDDDDRMSVRVIKEFIKRLKDTFNEPVYHLEPTTGHHLIRDTELIKRIDKLAGDKLK
jgi:hypothetical protein